MEYKWGSEDTHVSTEYEHIKCRQLWYTALEMKAQGWKLNTFSFKIILLEFLSLVTSAQIGIWLPCSSDLTPLSSFDMYTKDVVYITPLPTTSPEVAGRYCCGYITPAMLTDVWKEPEYRDVAGYSESTLQCRLQKASGYDVPHIFSFNSCIYS